MNTLCRAAAAANKRNNVAGNGSVIKSLAQRFRSHKIEYYSSLQRCVVTLDVIRHTAHSSCWVIGK